MQKALVATFVIAVAACAESITPHNVDSIEVARPADEVAEDEPTTCSGDRENCSDRYLFPRPPQRRDRTRLTGLPHPEQVRAAFETLKPAVARCAHSGVAIASVEVDGTTGVPTSVTVTGAPSAASFCVERAVGDLRMFPFGGVYRVKYPFKLGWEAALEAIFPPVRSRPPRHASEPDFDPNELTGMDASNAIGPVQDAVYRDCTGTDRVLADVTVDGLTGTVESVHVLDADHATAACVAEHLRKAQFRKVDDRTFNLRFPFRLREP